MARDEEDFDYIKPAPAPTVPKAPTTPKPTTPPIYTPGTTWDTPDTAASEFDFGSSAPGFAIGQGMTLRQYQDWLKVVSADPGWSRLRAVYGQRFQEFAWYAYRTGMDETAFNNTLSVEFPGWQNATNGGSSGYRRGGGGGGGVSKAQQYAAAEAAIRNQAATLGLPMDDKAIKALARTVVGENWSGDQLTDHLLSDPSKITLQGSYSAMADQLRKMAAAQLVTISDDTSKDWAKRILSGELQLDTVSSILQQQAVSEFGWAAGSLTAGATMSDILAPARDTVASELEMSSSDVDLMKPEFRKLVQVQADDGTMRAATLTEAQRNARKDARYSNTSGSARLTAQTATILRRVFEGG